MIVLLYDCLILSKLINHVCMYSFEVFPSDVIVWEISRERSEVQLSANTEITKNNHQKCQLTYNVQSYAMAEPTF